MPASDAQTGTIKCLWTQATGELPNRSQYWEPQISIPVLGVIAYCAVHWNQVLAGTTKAI